MIKKYTLTSLMVGLTMLYLHKCLVLWFYFIYLGDSTGQTNSFSNDEYILHCIYTDFDDLCDEDEENDRHGLEAKLELSAPKA